MNAIIGFVIVIGIVFGLHMIFWGHAKAQESSSSTAKVATTLIVVAILLLLVVGFMNSCAHGHYEQ